jgi:hypothetical protein
MATKKRDDERVQTICGVEGRYHGATVDGRNYKPGTFTSQRWGATKDIDYHGVRATMHVRLRFDDDCRNGHNTFAMTADVYRRDKRGADGGFLSGGCMHEEIAQHFPGLARLAKWHLCSTDGPMHYEANTVHFAGKRDCWGKLKGEPKRWATFVRFGTSPIWHPLTPKFAEWLQNPDVRLDDLEVIRIDKLLERDRETFGPKFTFGGYEYSDIWHKCPFDSEAGALEWAEALAGPHEFVRRPTAWGEGKERELDAARRAAVWPDATDEELSAEPDELRAALRARLPGLLAEFRADMEACGFSWEPGEERRADR